MNRCSHPDHPHCTVWVMPGERACAHGHVQPAAQAEAPAPSVVALPAHAPIAAPVPLRPHLHVSGFDPRAAGGRQVLKLDLRGMPPDCAAQVTLLASSRLQLENGERHSFNRTVRGEWLPVFLEFSSRGLEHGQYRIEVELHSRAQASGGSARTWIATLLILAPRADASLNEIHQTFLATHKNVRVQADDASIARVKARTGGSGRLDIDLRATNAGIAHLDLDTLGGTGNGAGKIDLGFSSIAWDEDLLEIDVPAEAAVHPCPAAAACLVLGETLDVQRPRYLRLFALDECVLGRGESDINGAGAIDADIRLMHHGEAGLMPEGLTRRISGRHALIRRGREGFEIEDVSRYGLLVDGVWPGKHAPVALRPGMRIEFTASIPGVAVLEVTAVLPNAIILQRLDAGMGLEAFYLMDLERKPDTTPRLGALGLPLLFHRDGGFWHLDPASGSETPLTPTLAAAGLAAWPAGARFAARPYPEHRNGPSTPVLRQQEQGAHDRRASA